MAVQVQERKSFWDTPITALLAVDWDKVILISLILLAVVTRFWDLGARAYNHDESIHTSWSHDLYVGKGYIHNPIYHGPLLYHLTAATFFLFGDSDVTGRVPNAVFGIVLIALPFFFRKWLGRRGWIITSLMLLISPVVTYYSRFNRHDIYVEVFVVLLALVIMKYYQAREASPQGGTAWLYAAALVLAFSFTAMETTFIFEALFAYFITAAFTVDYLRAREPEGNLTRQLALGGIFGIPFFAVWLVYLAGVRLFNVVRKENPRQEPWHESSSFDLAVVLGTLSLPLILAPLFVTFVLHRDPLDYTSTAGLISSGVVLVAFVIVSILIGALWNWRKWMVCALLFYPVTVFFFTTVFTNIPGGIGSGFIGSLGYWLSQQAVQRGSQPPYYYWMVLLPQYEYLPYLFGLAGLFYILFKRGSLRLGYFLVVLLPLLAIITYCWFTTGVLDLLSKALPILAGKDPSQAILQTGNSLVLMLIVLLPVFFVLVYDPRDASARVTTLIGIWTLGVLIIFSWAGEKMPWLTMHLTIPLSFVTGYFMERVLDVDWRGLWRHGAGLFGLVLALAILTFGIQVLIGPAPLNTGQQNLDQLAQRATSILSAVIVVLCAFALYYLGRRLGGKNSIRLAVATVFALLALFTIHSMSLAAFQNSDLAVETIIYAQGTPDEPAAMSEIQELSRRLCSQVSTDSTKVKLNCENGTIKVAYDDQSSWPFVWYLRDYTNAQYYGKAPGVPFDAEVVIVGPENEGAVKSFLGSRYVRRQMRLIWWPDEYYKDLTWTRLFGGKDANGSDVQGLLVGDNLRSLIRDIWFYHKYPHSLSSWPYVHTFALYVRKDVAGLLWQYSGVVPQPQTTEEDPYTKNYLTNVQAAAAVGTAGAGNGQLSQPRNVAVDSQGNIYVADSQNNRVERFDRNGTFVTQWGGYGNGQDQFNEPWGIAVDKDGNVYVADTWNHRIEKFDAGGKFLLQWGKFGDAGHDQIGPDQFYGPRAIAVDPDGNLWVADTGNKRILKFSPDGKSLGAFGAAGSDPGQFLEPVGVAADAQGNIYVADTWNQRVQEFDKNFQPVRQWTVDAWGGQSVLNKPYLAVDAKGNVYATDPEGYRIVEFSNDGKVIAVWGSKGNTLTTLDLPTGIAVRPDSRIYVADSNNNRILIFAPPKP